MVLLFFTAPYQAYKLLSIDQVDNNILVRFVHQETAEEWKPSEEFDYWIEGRSNIHHLLNDNAKQTLNNLRQLKAAYERTFKVKL